MGSRLARESSVTFPGGQKLQLWTPSLSSSMVPTMQTASPQSAVASGPCPSTGRSLPKPRFP